MRDNIIGLFGNNVVFSLFVLAAALVIGILLYFLVMFLLLRWHKNRVLEKFSIDPRYLRGPLRFLIPALSVFAVSPLLELPDGTQSVISHVISLLLIGSIGWLLVGIVHTTRKTILEHYDIDSKDNLKARSMYTQIRVIDSIITVAIIVLTLAVMLMTFGQVRRIGTSLLASAGILGIILGFAAQKTLGNLIAGLQIALAQPIRLDDVVVVEGEWGVWFCLFPISWRSLSRIGRAHLRIFWGRCTFTQIIPYR
jgi:small-conductance mechanosensitive channel